MNQSLRLLATLILISTQPVAAHNQDGQHAHPIAYSQTAIHAPSPMPDRVILTWSGNPATSQSATWRTDTSVKKAVAEIALANANGRALQPKQFEAQTSSFSSDINEAHYHSLTFNDLQPDTLYTYRVGDGVNWSEYFHFRTASERAKPFSFIYFGDAQNELKTHWSRVFREAFRDAPRAAFTLHAGDLINEDAWDAEWGEWHGAPAWVNGTVPVIATPGNHEYYRAEQGPENERFWTRKDGTQVAVDIELREATTEQGERYFKVHAQTKKGEHAYLEYDDDDNIIFVDEGVEALTGFNSENLLGSDYDDPPINDQRRDQGVPMVSKHWRHQFAFPVQKPPKGLEETVYYIDYQGTRIISLDSNKERKAQVRWLRNVLKDNPNRWTILTFHHPIFSPASDRDNRELRELWKPIIDEYKVDLVLSGHDHTYARTGDVSDRIDFENIPSGYQQAYDSNIGTVYVVSVSGPKLYDITKGNYAKRVAEDTQLYQIIEIEDAELRYKAFTATGELYDAFSLEKNAGKANSLKEILPPEKRSTLEEY